MAELASMAMELLSMEAWDEFYTDEEELKRAKREQMEKVLEGLPWIAAIDKFQQWIYTTEHTAEERRAEWANIMGLLGSSVVDWEGHEEAYLNLWQKQLHLYEVPSLHRVWDGAIRSYCYVAQLQMHGEKALDNYMDALRLGYTNQLESCTKRLGLSLTSHKNM